MPVLRRSNSAVSPTLIAFLATLLAFMVSKFAGLGDTETTVLSGVLGFLSRDLIPNKDVKE